MLFHLSGALLVPLLVWNSVAVAALGTIIDHCRSSLPFAGLASGQIEDPFGRSQFESKSRMLFGKP